MFTKKSFILVVALLLALVCAGTISAFAATATPVARTVKRANVHYWNRGIPAIPHHSSSKSALVTRAEVIDYLNSRGFIAGGTLHGRRPTIDTLLLTDLSNLRDLDHITVPGLPLKSRVFFTKISGPFLVNHRPSLSLLSILIPNSQTIPLLHGLRDFPLLDQLITLNGIPGLNGTAGITALVGSDNIFSLGSLDDLTSGLGIDHLLATVFEIFDANNGNLLAWG